MQVSLEVVPGKIIQQRVRRFLIHDAFLKNLTILDRTEVIIFVPVILYDYDIPGNCLRKSRSGTINNVFLRNVPLIHPRGDIRIRIRDTPAVRCSAHYGAGPIELSGHLLMTARQ